MNLIFMKRARMTPAWPQTRQLIAANALAHVKPGTMRLRAGSPPAKALFSQTDLPSAVEVPAGHRVAQETVAVCRISCECRAKADLPARARPWGAISARPPPGRQLTAAPSPAASSPSHRPVPATSPCSG